MLSTWFTVYRICCRNDESVMRLSFMRLVQESLVHPDTGALQQVLGYRRLEDRVQFRAIRRKRIVARDVAYVVMPAVS